MTPWQRAEIVAALQEKFGPYESLELICCLGSGSRPTVVCLCGSTRFHDAFLRVNYNETMAGRIVLSVAFYPDVVDGVHGETVGCNLQQKEMLDELHLRRIDLCDEILVLNVDGYIGESTTRERDYAIKTGKLVRYLEAFREG